MQKRSTRSIQISGGKRFEAIERGLRIAYDSDIQPDIRLSAAFEIPFRHEYPP
jgi:hypothetical protein